MTRAPARRESTSRCCPALLRPVVYLCAAFAFAFPLSTLEHRAARLRAARASARSLGAAGRGFAAAAADDRAARARGDRAGERRPRRAALERGARGLARPVGRARGRECASGSGCARALRRGRAARGRAAAARLFRALEVAFVGAAFAQLVVGHRGGAINRPFELADSIIAQGRRPDDRAAPGRRARRGGVRHACCSASAALLALARCTWRWRSCCSRWCCSARRACSGCRRPSSAQSGLGLRPDEKSGKQQQQSGRGGGQGKRGGEPPRERAARVPGQLRQQRPADPARGRAAARRLLAADRALLLPPGRVQPVQRPAPGAVDARRRRQGRRARLRRSSRPSSPTCPTSWATARGSRPPSRCSPTTTGRSRSSAPLEVEPEQQPRPGALPPRVPRRVRGARHRLRRAARARRRRSALERGAARALHRRAARPALRRARERDRRRSCPRTCATDQVAAGRDGVALAEQAGHLQPEERPRRGRGSRPRTSCSATAPATACTSRTPRCT